MVVGSFLKLVPGDQMINTPHIHAILSYALALFHHIADHKKRNGKLEVDGSRGGDTDVNRYRLVHFICHRSQHELEI